MCWRMCSLSLTPRCFDFHKGWASREKDRGDFEFLRQYFAAKGAQPQAVRYPDIVSFGLIDALSQKIVKPSSQDSSLESLLEENEKYY